MANIFNYSNQISILQASDSPLSADVVIIALPKETLVFDVGASEEALETINQITGPKTFVLSHFHEDHTGNLASIIPFRTEFDKFYAGDYTCKKYPAAITVSEPIIYADTMGSPRITIFPLPSSHSKGCVGLEVGDIAFLGDGTYAGKRVYNVSLLAQTIRTLEGLSATNVYLSHNSKIQDRMTLINSLKRIYALRKPGEAYIQV